VSSIADIDMLGRKTCIAKWEKLTGVEVPKRLSIEFMRRALAYEQQCKMVGGLPAKSKRTLAAVAAGRSITESSRPALSSGTHLVREWNGRTYQVEVLNDGFLLDGKKYKSLSAIARKITGAHWSGPRFFGLTNNSEQASSRKPSSRGKFQTNATSGSAQ
jgi:hypothetical protein